MVSLQLSEDSLTPKCNDFGYLRIPRAQMRLVTAEIFVRKCRPRLVVQAPIQRTHLYDIVSDGLISVVV